MTEVQPLLESPNGAEASEAAADYAAERAVELSTEDSNKPIDRDAGGTDRFIGPEAPLSMATLGNAYHMDDPSAYEAAFAGIRSTYAQLREKMPPEQAYLNAVIAGVNHGQAYYFRSYLGQDKSRFAASLDIIDDDEVVKGATSIADYKDNALCLERAAVAHNSAHIYGVDTSLHIGRLTTTTEDGEASDEAHAFLVVPGIDGREFIFDPTNPIVIRNEDGTIAAARPSLYQREPGVDQQVVKLKELELVNGQMTLKATHALTYTFDPKLA